MGAEKTINILLVDDDPRSLTALAAAVSALDLNVVKVNSGKEALKRLLDQDFALIILDVQMEDTDGFQTARLIRSRDRTRHTPIIFLTGMYTQESDVLQGYELGAVDYIVKPCRPEILRAKVSVFVKLHRKTEEVRSQSERLRLAEVREYEHQLLEARRELEAENVRVREERRVAQAILQHAPVGIVRLDRKLAILDANPVFARQFGVEPETLAGKSIFKELPGLPKKPVVRAIEKGERIFLEALKIDRQPGLDRRDREGYWDLAVWPVTLDNAEVIGAILLCVDVTARVRLNQQREEFVATLAHDLQTPLAASDRMLELLLNQLGEKLGTAELRLFSMLRENNSSILALVQTLLDVYRFESGAEVLYLDDFDLQLNVLASVDALQPLAGKHSVEIVADLPDALPPLRADRVALRRVIMNLLDNAIKFTASGGSIVARARNLSDAVLLEVINPGPGIPLQDQERLFERFWHRPGERGGRSGTGLGLYLCRQIVEAHGGRISYESEAGQSIFQVWLPVSPSGGGPRRSTRHLAAEGAQLK